MTAIVQNTPFYSNYQFCFLPTYISNISGVPNTKFHRRLFILHPDFRNQDLLQTLEHFQVLQTQVETRVGYIRPRK